MKEKFTYILVVVALLLGSASSISGQIASNTYQDVAKYESIDTDIRAMRFATMPNFRYKYDDYIQYSPGVVLIGLKAFGVGADIPLMAGRGLSANLRANTLSYKDGNIAMMYDGFLGIYQNFLFVRILELQLKAMLGYTTSFFW